MWHGIAFYNYSCTASFQFMVLDEADDFLNVVSSSLSKDTSTVKFS